MNFIRSIISLFMLAVLFVTVAGWFWTADLPASKAIGARVALGLCAALATGTICLIWAAKDTQVN